MLRWWPLVFLLACDDPTSGGTADGARDAAADAAPSDATRDRGVPDASRDRGVADASRPDASRPDASRPDAALDARVGDAGLDAASHDAALPDGALPDGALPDAVAPADATLPDAALPDAALPDAAVGCRPDPSPPWTRPTIEPGEAAVFAELFVNGPADNQWLELYNPQAIDLDLSGWHLAGAITYTFPEATFMAAGGRLVVAADPNHLGVADALGPWSGAFAPDAPVELRNGRDRLMDTVTWGDCPLWPAVPDAGGALTRRAFDGPSGLAEAWTLGPGTPGAAEDLGLARAAVLVPPEATWRFDDGDAPDWAGPDFADGAWPAAAAPFFAGAPAAAQVTVRVTADNYVAAYVGARDGTGLRPIGRDLDGNWQTPEDLVVEAAAGEHLFLAAWEAPGDSGSPQMLIAQVTDAEGVRQATSEADFEVALGPPNQNPGPPPNPAPDPAVLAGTVAAAAWQAPAVGAPRDAGPWGPAVGGAFDPAARFLWLDTFDPASLTNTQETWALFRARQPLVAPSGTELPAVVPRVRFRTHFNFAGDPAAVRLQLSLTVDDSAVVYLNGEELYRLNLQGDPDAANPQAAGPGSPPTQVAVPADALRAGPNVLAVAVIQAAPDGGDLRFGATLETRPLPLAPRAAAAPDLSPVVFNELMYHPAEGDTEWIELYNRGVEAVDLTDWRLVDAVGFRFPAGTVVEPGAYLVVARTAAEFRRVHPDVPFVGGFQGGLSNDGEQLTLLDPCGEVADTVRWYAGGRWPTEPDGDGASLELMDARGDNGVAEAWAASDERHRSAWQTLSWRGVAAPSAVGPDGQWHELVLGLLGAGEVLIDDVHVVRNPDGEAAELLQNGTFDADTTAWRLLGTHRHSAVVPDPDDATNPVLRLVATGSAEHMHNHAETTLAAGARITNGTEYAISLRARWIAGANQLNARLYFNRLARTVRLDRPGPGGTPGAPNSRAVPNSGPTFAGFAHAPVVPAPNEPVTVSIAVEDPDSVAQVTLWATPDGAEPLALPMATDDGHRYLATVPGLPIGTLVQLYVEATDTRGATTTYPAAGPASRALYVVDTPRLGPGGLPALRILMTAADQAVFHAPTELMSNDLTRATVIFNETETFENIGVRAKGSERGRPTAVRLGYGLRFDPDHLFRGAHASISLDRSEGVRFGQRELLMDLVMARGGALSAEYNDLAHLIAPRPEQTGPVLLQLARFGDGPLDRQFDNGGDGMLFEYELIYYPTTTDTGTPEGRKLPQPDQVVGSNLRDLGPDPEGWRHTFLIKNNRGRDDYTGIMQFGAVFGLPDDVFRAAVDTVIDVDEWLRSAAFATLCGAVDHYGAGAQHNVWFYVRPSDGRVLYFPHDLDFYPGDPRQAIVANRDLARLLAVPAWRRRFYAHLLHITDTAYNAAYLARWRDQLGALLPGQDFAGHHRFMTERAAWVLHDAPDALDRVYPPVDFALTTGDGGPVAVQGPTTRIEGTGWLDLATLTLNGQPLPFTWLDGGRWQAEVPLEVGENHLDIEALNDAGDVVGRDTIDITRLPD